MPATIVTGDLRFRFFGKKGERASFSKGNLIWKEVRQHCKEYPDGVEITVFLECFLDIYGEKDLYYIEIFRTSWPVEDSTRRERLAHLLEATGHTVDPDQDL